MCNLDFSFTIKILKSVELMRGVVSLRHHLSLCQYEMRKRETYGGTSVYKICRSIGCAGRVRRLKIKSCRDRFLISRETF